MTQRALSIKSCGMSSGTSIISFSTVPAFCKRSFSFSSLSFADETGELNGISAKAPAKSTVKRILFIRTTSFEIVSQNSLNGLVTAIRRQNHHSADQGQHAQNRRDGYGVVFFFGGLNGADVQNLFVRGIRDALIG